MGLKFVFKKVLGFFVGFLIINSAICIICIIQVTTIIIYLWI